MAYNFTEFLVEEINVTSLGKEKPRFMGNAKKGRRFECLDV